MYGRHGREKMRFQSGLDREWEREIFLFEERER